MTEYLRSKSTAVIVQVLLVALLVFTPLAFGTVETWAISVMELVCLVMVAVWLVGFAIGGGADWGLRNRGRAFRNPKSEIRNRMRFPLAGPLVLFTGLVIAQVVPHLLGGNAVPLSDNPLLNIATTGFFSTKTQLVKLLCYLGLFLCLTNTLTSREQIKRVFMAIVLIGFSVSFFGLLQRVGRADKVFWLIKVPRGSFMAAFINENHFAGYVELVIPITIAFVLRYVFRLKESGWRRTLASNDFYKAIILSFLAVIMIASLAISESRGGLIAFACSCVFIGIFLLCRQFYRRKAWIITILLAISFLVLVWIGLSDLLKVWGTFGRIPKDSSFLRRMEVTQATWRAVGDYPVWGSGLGTFETVFPKYGTLRFTQRSATRSVLRTTPHAENDYVQTLLETGWAGMTICLLGMIFFFRIAIRTYLNPPRRGGSTSLLAMGGAVSILAILVHSFSDFNLRIDANVFLMVTIVAMVVNLSKVGGGRRGPRIADCRFRNPKCEMRSAVVGMNRWAIVAIPLMFCLVLMEAVARQFVADRAFSRSQARERIQEYEKEYVLYSMGKRNRPAPITSLGHPLEKAVRLEPHSGQYRNYLGRYYQALATDHSLSDARRVRLAKQAIEQYEKTVRLEPLNGVYLAYLAYMQGVMGEHEKAVANFEEAVRLNKSNKWIRQVYNAYRDWAPPPSDSPARSF
ncbi:O-antigen ligase family protein [bacterium]|nr:O-antigen ligase family protein [bacterium]